MRKGVEAIAVLFFVAVPLVANADQLSDLHSQLQALLSQIASLQSQQTAPSTPTASSCPTLSGILTLGSRGPGVHSLQQFLATQFQTFTSDYITGYYGPITQAAVQEWQREHGIVSSGSPSTTGWGVVGPHTRAAMASACWTVATNTNTAGTTPPSQSLAPVALPVETILQTPPPVYGGGGGGGRGAAPTPPASVAPPVSCTINGLTVGSGQSQIFYSQGGVSYGDSCSNYSQVRTCTAGSLSGSDMYGYSSCTVGQPASCSFNGQSLATGKSVTAYQASTVPYGEQCATEQRTCNDGTLSGSYQYASCTVGSAASCTFNGQTVQNGASVSAYESSRVTYGQQCATEQRTCNDGTLSGSYQYSSCSVGAAASCTLAGQTIQNGQSLTAYQAASVSYGQQCVSQTRTCSNGVLSGSYQYASCVVGSAASCSFNGQTIQSGQSVTAYQTASVAYGQQCVSQARTCTNGSLSGTYLYTSCSARTAASCVFNGQTLQTGASVTAYPLPTTAYGLQCPQQTRTCTNGSLSGSYQYSSCSPMQTPLVGFWQIAALGSADDLISQTANVSNIALFGPDQNGTSTPRIQEAASIGLKSVIMVQNAFFDSNYNLLPNYQTVFDIWWNSIDPADQANVIGFYLVDEPYGHAVWPQSGSPTVTASQMQANLETATAYMKQEAPGRAVMFTEGYPSVERSDFTSYIPDNVDYIGVNCYVAWLPDCSDSLLAQLVSKLAANQRLIVTADGYWASTPTGSDDSLVRSRIIYWETLLAPYFASGKVGALTPFTYQSYPAINPPVYGLSQMPLSLGEVERYMTSVKNGAPSPSSATDLSRAAGADASAQYQSDSPLLVTDANPATAWSSGGLAPQWIELDLTQPYRIQEVKLTVAQDPSGQTTDNVYDSPDGSNWQLLTTFSGATTNGQVLDYTPSAPPYRIRYIKVETTQSPSWVAWSDIDVYGY